VGKKEGGVFRGRKESDRREKSDKEWTLLVRRLLLIRGNKETG